MMLVMRSPYVALALSTKFAMMSARSCARLVTLLIKFTRYCHTYIFSSPVPCGPSRPHPSAVQREELDEKLTRGEYSESDTFDDFTWLDYLEGKEEKLRTFLEQLA